MVGKLLLITITGICGHAQTLLANEAHEQLMASSEEVRRAAFRLIVAGAGETCRTVTRTYFQGETATGGAVWNIDCGKDNAYRIEIAPADGSTKLIDCRLIQPLQATECFKPLPGRE